MKILSIEEAIEKGLLRETTNGVAINDINNIMNLEQKEIAQLLGNINNPSIIVSDDEKRVLCTNISKRVQDKVDGYTESRKYTFPRVYTSDNTPVLVGGISYSGRFPDYTHAIQDNQNIDIEEYTLRIKTAKGVIGEKGKLNKETNLIEEMEELNNPIQLNFKDNTLEIIGEKIYLEEDEKFKEVLPVIDRSSFMDYEYYIELADGRKSDLTYGYMAKPSLSRVCLDIIQKIDKLKIIGNLDEKDIECGEYNGTIKTQDNYIEMNPAEVECIDIEDEMLNDLLNSDNKTITLETARELQRLAEQKKYDAELLESRMIETEKAKKAKEVLDRCSITITKEEMQELKELAKQQELDREALRNGEKRMKPTKEAINAQDILNQENLIVEENNSEKVLFTSREIGKATLEQQEKTIEKLEEENSRKENQKILEGELGKE